MLSQTAEYALRAAVFLAQRFDDPQTTRAIAGATQVPEGYLAKVLQSLARAGLVRSQRGLHGGFAFARHPKDVSILDVLQAVDPVRRIDACGPGRGHGSEKLCTLHQTLDDIQGWIEERFRTASIADMLNGPSNARPLCPCAQGQSQQRDGMCGDARTPAASADNEE